MNKRTGLHYCFACHFGGNAVTLAKDIAGVPLSKLLGKDGDFQTKSRTHNYSLTTEQSAQKKVRRRKPIDLQGNEYDPFQFPHVKQMLRKLSINREFVEHFGLTYVKYATINGTEFVDRLLFKVYENGRLRNVEGRDVTGEQTPKVLYPYKGDIYNVTSDVLWNYDQLRHDEPLVVCEGIKDTIKIWRYVTRNVTSLFGNKVGANQKKQLLGFQKLIVFADNDAGGDELIDQIDDLIKDREFYIATTPHRGQDPADLNRDELAHALTHPLEAVDHLLEVAEQTD